MKTAYEQLGVAETAGDEEIRKAYLLQIQLYPPDRDPAQFQLVRDAYDLIKNKRSRANYRLFHSAPVDIKELFASSFADGTARRPGVDLMLRCLKGSL